MLKKKTDNRETGTIIREIGAKRTYISHSVKARQNSQDGLHTHRVSKTDR